MLPLLAPRAETGQVEMARLQERGRLLPGQLFNDEAVASPETASLKVGPLAGRGAGGRGPVAGRGPSWQGDLAGRGPSWQGA